MSDSKDLWTVGDVLDAMSSPRIPNFMVGAVREVQNWLASAISEEYPLDPIDFSSREPDRSASAELDYLFERLEWVDAYADLVPTTKGIGRHEDAIVLSVGSILLDEGLRMMTDHAALFARETCKRVWVVSDTWIIGDVLIYMPHVKALHCMGVEVRFLLVTPWGYSEIPWNRGGAPRRD